MFCNRVWAAVPWGHPRRSNSRNLEIQEHQPQVHTCMPMYIIGMHWNCSSAIVWKCNDIARAATSYTASEAALQSEDTESSGMGVVGLRFGARRVYRAGAFRV